MSFIHDIVAHQFAKKGEQEGIKGKSLSSLAKRQDIYVQHQSYPWYDINHKSKPKDWTNADSFLAKIFQTDVKYVSNGHGTEAKTIGRYSSNPILRLLKDKKSNLTEADLLKDKIVIEESCDLRGTTLESLPKTLKKIGKNLTIDTTSPLKDLSSLTDIGKITVIAKNQSDVGPFLQKLGIMAHDGTLLASVKDGIHFVMKSYL